MRATIGMICPRWRVRRLRTPLVLRDGAPDPTRSPRRRGGGLVAPDIASKVASQRNAPVDSPSTLVRPDVELLRFAPLPDVPGHGVDVADLFQALQEPAELGEVGDLDAGVDLGGRLVVKKDICPHQVDLRLRHRPRYAAEQAGPVPGLDLDGDREGLVGTPLPLPLHQPVRVAG